VNVKLTCKNEGRSPAWIDCVYARADIVSDRSDIRAYDCAGCSNFGLMEPIAVGRENSRVLSLDCEGYVEEGQFISIYVIVSYHDIFGLPRKTTMGYSLVSGELYRQNGAPDRNRNT
jgi:hypothetical protein